MKKGIRNLTAKNGDMVNLHVDSKHLETVCVHTVEERTYLTSYHSTDVVMHAVSAKEVELVVPVGCKVVIRESKIWDEVK